LGKDKIILRSETFKKIINNTKEVEEKLKIQKR
jgi:hypothetical protein